MKRMLHRLMQSNEVNIERVTTQNNQLLQELAIVQKSMDEMRSVLTRLRPVAPSVRRGGLFSRRRSSVPVTVEPEVKPKLSLPLEDLLPLLPQLGGVIPQLNNPKVKETMKLLGNPAIMGMIQQFLANGGLKGKTQALPKGRG